MELGSTLLLEELFGGGVPGVELELVRGLKGAGVSVVTVVMLAGVGVVVGGGVVELVVGAGVVEEVVSGAEVVPVLLVALLKVSDVLVALVPSVGSSMYDHSRQEGWRRKTKLAESCSLSSDSLLELWSVAKAGLSCRPSPLSRMTGPVGCCPSVP
eukprot:CAMPEP_0181297302 /NCGR_PEP_ID=MMETSP1101-20121128/5166_1 /TAXON_ID=46948 /ORGANISM="Rhodomonas abbreviata, Strain Caron Lab Isolate" /LENGTH=155 /DNA_ID=CAMNT_0023402227 /DNA_START=423 /DNA_END=890 /DNA_ORIENTATION=-